MAHANNKKESFKNFFREADGHPVGNNPPTPVVPKMLTKALKTLQKKTLKGLFFSARDVTCEILRSLPQVEQNFEVLYFEVSDKLACAAAAGIIGLRSDNGGYYALNARQKSNSLDFRSELTFWVFYKRLLAKRAEEFKRIKNKKNAAVAPR